MKTQGLLHAKELARSHCFNAKNDKSINQMDPSGSRYGQKRDANLIVTFWLRPRSFNSTVPISFDPAGG